MSTITDVKCVLSQRVFDIFFKKFHIPKEVHLVLPNRGDTIHKRPTGKIGLYTRFFNFANFRLPLSTFLVNILRHFRINISQLSVIKAAKVSHFEILCRVYGITPTVGLFRCFYVNSKKNGWISFIKHSDKSLVCYTKPLDSLKNWIDHFFWVDDFACPARFLWHTAKNVTKDLAPATTNFNAQDYATLLATSLLIVLHFTDMDIFAFIHTTNPSKLRLTVAKASWTPMLTNCFIRAIVVPIRTTDTVAEDVIPLQPRRQKKRKTIIADAGGPSHPPKKLREDHKNPSGASVGSKSRSAVQRLLAGAVQNVEVRGELIPTLPFVTSSVSSTPEREVEDHTDSAEVDSFARPSVPVIAAATTITSTADPVVVVKEKIAKPSLFSTDSTSVSGTDSAMGGFMDFTGSDSFWWAACQISISVEVRMRAEYNIREKRRLKSVVKEKDQSLKARDEEIENLKAQMLLKEAEATEAICLRTEASNFETVKKSIRVEVNALNERNTILKKECNALDVKVKNLEASVVRKERELTDSNAQLTSIKSQND
ncbi:hypothetical protein Tco_0801169, partial [Tanacetum coccineum]